MADCLTPLVLLVSFKFLLAAHFIDRDTPVCEAFSHRHALQASRRQQRACHWLHCHHIVFLCYTISLQSALNGLRHVLATNFVRCMDPLPITDLLLVKVYDCQPADEETHKMHVQLSEILRL